MKTKPSITGVEIGNIVFELDEACAALKLTEDEHKFAVAAVVAAWVNYLPENKNKSLL